MIDPERSRIMRAVKSRDTGPEVAIRSLLHRLGYRFRLHRRDLPGCPDLVFPSRKAVLFVHGCFWHGHDCKRGARIPKANRAYWRAKIRRNALRDADHLRKLKSAGWRVMTVWECSLKDELEVARRINRFLRPRSS